MNKQPVGTFTANHTDGTLETLTFAAGRKADVAHSLTSGGETHSNTIDRREARAILRVWNAWGIVS